MFCPSKLYSSVSVSGKSSPRWPSSIPAAAWWGIATLTTVGYGDVYPVTTLGKLADSVVAVLGIAERLVANRYARAMHARARRPVVATC